MSTTDKANQVETAQDKQDVYEAVKDQVSQVQKNFPKLPDDVKTNVTEGAGDISDKEALQSFKERVRGMIESNDLDELHRYNQKAFRQVIGPYLRKNLSGLRDLAKDNIAVEGMRKFDDIDVMGTIGYGVGKYGSVVAGMTVGFLMALIASIVRAGYTAAENKDGKRGVREFASTFTDTLKSTASTIPSETIGSGTQAAFSVLSGLARPGENEASVQSMFDQATDYELIEMYFEVGEAVADLSQSQFNDLCDVLREQGIDQEDLDQALQHRQNTAGPDPDSEQTEQLRRMQRLVDNF